jgi:hypothetical protein
MLLEKTERITVVCTKIEILLHKGCLEVSYD